MKFKHKPKWYCEKVGGKESVLILLGGFLLQGTMWWVQMDTLSDIIIKLDNFLLN